jgi:hypothetical protein
MLENKEILTLEFRYFDVRENSKPFKSKTICLGIFNSYEDAVNIGNEVLEEIFEKQFNIISKKDKLSMKNRSVSDSVVIPRDYLKCHFAYYLKIETLEFSNVKETLLEVLKTFNTL